MYLIEITEPAYNDLKQTVSYITNELRNPQAALCLVDLAEEAIASLSEMPERYPLVKDDKLAKQGIRIIQVKKYLVFYAVRRKTRKVVIERFLYAGRDWVNLLNLNDHNT